MSNKSTTGKENKPLEERAYVTFELVAKDNTVDSTTSSLDEWLEQYRKLRDRYNSE